MDQIDEALDTVTAVLVSRQARDERHLGAPPRNPGLRHCLALPGFSTGRPPGFTGTKDAYADWLGETITRLGEPIDLVGHDLGALETMPIASAFDVPLRSWTVDVANIFHPGCIYSVIADLQGDRVFGTHTT